MVTSISRKRATVVGDVVVKTVASSLDGMARNLDIGGSPGLVSIVHCNFTLIMEISLHNVFAARLFDYFDSGVMERLQHRLLELATSRTQGQLAETPGNSMALTSQVSYKCKIDY